VRADASAVQSPDARTGRRPDPWLLVYILIGRFFLRGLVAGSLKG
jgi:hypothetical protein